MTKLILLMIAATLLISNGCSYNITKEKYVEKEKYYEKVNKLCAEKDDCTITTKEQNSFIGREIKIMSDSTSFYNIEIESKQTLATNQISEIKFKGTGSSIFEGFLFGGIGGGLLGNFISNPSSPGLEKVISVGGGILVGGVIGIMVAIIYPNYTIMNFSGEQEWNRNSS